MERVEGDRRAQIEAAPDRRLRSLDIGSDAEHRDNLTTGMSQLRARRMRDGSDAPARENASEVEEIGRGHAGGELSEAALDLIFVHRGSR
ncbi:hypothetical protein GCM10009643_09390 [Microbacterium aurantiacum]